MATLKKVLVVSYYWPPSSGVGVKRWLFFSNELAKRGIKVYVLTPENPQFNVRDESSLELIHPNIEVMKIPIWEPFAIMQKLTGGKNKGQVKQGLVLEKEKQGFLDKLFIWIRGNVFIPDARRFWKKPASDFIIKFVEDNPVDVMITTSPPHSMHLVGLRAKQKTGIKWIADLRDPWSNWDLLDKLKTNALGKSIQQKLEKQVIKNADFVMATSPRQAEDLKKLGAKKSFSLNNGFQEIKKETRPAPTDVFRVSHLGLLNELRNPVEFWETLNTLCEKNSVFAEKLVVSLYGIIGDSVKEAFKRWPVLAKKVEYHGYLEQKDLHAKMEEAAVLLVIQNRSQNATRIIPYKLYEYLPMQRPIIQIGAAFGDSNDLIENLKVGSALVKEDKVRMEEVMTRLFEKWQNGEAQTHVNISEFSYQALAEKLVTEIEKIIQ